MKNTLIVAAVASLAAGSALAQSSVTIYGRANVSAENQKNIGAVGTQRVLQNSASRIGFKGTEDLGGGLKANFILEHGFNIDTGAASSSAFWARQSEVNLSSASFGTVRLGNFTSEAYFATADYISMHNHDTGTSEDKLYAYIGRNTNKIAYRTPEFVKGLTAEAAVSAGEGAVVGGVVQPRTYDGAVNYAAGPLQLGLGYEKAGESKQIGVRGLYEMGPVVLGAYYQRHDDAALGVRNLFRVSAAYMVGQSEFHVNVGRSGDFDKLTKSAATQYTVAYNYNLSKRTKLYAFYTAVNNGDNLSFFGAKQGAKVLDPKSLAFGMRHNF
jgi:predicted porin